MVGVDGAVGVVRTGTEALLSALRMLPAEVRGAPSVGRGATQLLLALLKLPAEVCTAPMGGRLAADEPVTTGRELVGRPTGDPAAGSAGPEGVYERPRSTLDALDLTDG